MKDEDVYGVAMILAVLAFQHKDDLVIEDFQQTIKSLSKNDVIRFHIDEKEDCLHVLLQRDKT